MRVAICGLLLCAQAAWADAKYELADLQALAKSSSWEELVEHLEDLPPSKRDATWLALAEQSCAGLLEAQKIDENSAEGVLRLADRMLKRFGALKQSRAFLAKRAEVGLKAFGFTYSNSRHSAGDDPWMDQLKEFVAADAITADLPQRAAKKVQSRLVAQVAWPLWKTALDRGASVCEDADFQASIIAAIARDVWSAQTHDVANGKCAAALKAPLAAAFDKADEAGLKHLCPFLKARGALTAAQTSKCNDL